MDQEEFIRFYFFLYKEHLINESGLSYIDELYKENEEMGIAISNDFYKTYKNVRNNLYSSLKELNPDVDELLLFTKTQKLMDRFTFICFCEDSGLLPHNIYKNLIESVNNRYSFETNKLWRELKGLFKSIDIGRPAMKINRYNGGLFKEDPELDNLEITDEVLLTFTQLANYDFGSDLNVNILWQMIESLPQTDRWYRNARVDSVSLTNMRYRNGWIESIISHIEYNNRFKVSFGKVFAEVYFLRQVADRVNDWIYNIFMHCIKR